MLVEFVLIMEDLTLDNQLIDKLIIMWQQNLSQIDVLEISHRWITSTNFLTQRMIGLQRVGESSLTIEPQEDVQDLHIPL